MKAKGIGLREKKMKEDHFRTIPETILLPRDSYVGLSYDTKFFKKDKKG
jgi:hypothetical protein